MDILYTYYLVSLSVPINHSFIGVVHHFERKWERKNTRKKTKLNFNGELKLSNLILSLTYNSILRFECLYNQSSSYRER